VQLTHARDLKGTQVSSRLLLGCGLGVMSGPTRRGAAEPFGEALWEIYERVRTRELAPERATERIFALLKEASRIRARPSVRRAAPRRR
jgi:hypothetical protein